MRFLQPAASFGDGGQYYIGFRLTHSHKAGMADYIYIYIYTKSLGFRAPPPPPRDLIPFLEAAPSEGDGG